MHNLFSVDLVSKVYLGQSSLRPIKVSYMNKQANKKPQRSYLRQDGNTERLVAVFTHQVQGDDWEDVPGGGARQPAHQLLTQPET